MAAVGVSSVGAFAPLALPGMNGAAMIVDVFECGRVGESRKVASANFGVILANVREVDVDDAEQPNRRGGRDNSLKTSPGFC